MLGFIVFFKENTMNILLTKPLEAFIKNKVKTSEVIKAGLRELADQELEKNIQKGINEASQGLGTELNDGFFTHLVGRVEKRIHTNETK